MRNVKRGIAAGLLATPLVFGLSGMANAADFGQSHSMATPQGAAGSQTTGHTSDKGQGMSFQKRQSVAGPKGTGSAGTDVSTSDRGANGGYSAHRGDCGANGHAGDKGGGYGFHHGNHHQQGHGHRHAEHGLVLGVFAL
jgi:hypothetical protein